MKYITDAPVWGGGCRASAPLLKEMRSKRKQTEKMGGSGGSYEHVNVILFC
jgi:hypothetical protein